jgi:hypothetical protein
MAIAYAIKVAIWLNGFLGLPGTRGCAALAYIIARIYVKY